MQYLNAQMVADAINQLGLRFDTHAVEKRTLRLHTIEFAQELTRFASSQDSLRQFSAVFAKFIDLTFQGQIRQTSKVISENLGGEDSQNQEWEKLTTPITYKPLQLTAGICGFMNVFGVATGFGLSNVFGKTPAATELGSLGSAQCESVKSGFQVEERTAMNGLQLAEHFYFDCVQHIIAEHLPELNGTYAAGLIGYGSDVIGNDDELSRDHEWGPRLILFLREAEHHPFADKLDRILNEVLPTTFQGFPTRFHRQGTHGNSLIMTMSPDGGHHIAITTPERFMQLTLGFATIPQNEIQWLLIPEQRLLEFTSGAIFADPIGDITQHRQKFAYFPEAVWKYKLSYAFESLGWELGLISLCGRRGDILSMHLNTAITIERVMRLAFLLHRRFCPGYKKWLHREFSKLPPMATQIKPLLLKAFRSDEHCEIITHLNEALETLYEKLRHLNIGFELPDEIPRENYRGDVLINAQNIAKHLLESLPDPLRKLRIHNAPYGAIDQWVTNEDILLSPEHVKSLVNVYCASEAEQNFKKCKNI